MTKLIRRTSGRSLCLLALACLASAGCGGDGLDRQRIQGTVTFEGKPLELGAVMMEPAESVGTIAPSVALRVENGKFDTGDEGPIPGKYHVIVGGYDNANKRVDDDGVTHTSQMFKDHKFDVDIPVPDGVLNIEVPAALALKKQ